MSRKLTAPCALKPWRGDVRLWEKSLPWCARNSQSAFAAWARLRLPITGVAVL
ncbi:MAG: hypothetical protein ACUVR8_12680 [Acidobacteriota bacterium]